MKRSSRIDFYRNTRRGNILRLMSANYVTYWVSDSAISIIFALFVIQFIDGGSATHLGLSYLAYQLTAAIFSVPVGRFFDKHRGYIDEIYGLSLASFAAGSVYIILSFASELWHLYLAMIVLGFISNLNITSWRILFFRNIDKDDYGETLGIYRTITSLSYGLAFAISGLMGDMFGFDTVVFYAGIVVAVGGFLPLFARHYYRHNKKKSNK